MRKVIIKKWGGGVAEENVENMIPRNGMLYFFFFLDMGHHEEKMEEKVRKGRDTENLHCTTVPLRSTVGAWVYYTQASFRHIPQLHQQLHGCVV